MPSDLMLMASSPDRSRAGDLEFLAYLRDRFIDEEASAFSTTYAIHLYGREDEF
jgi:hypothetical protein